MGGPRGRPGRDRAPAAPAGHVRGLGGLRRPPGRLGDYLRDLQRLYDEFGYSNEAMPSLYGHFGQGCVHTRIQFDLYTTAGVAAFRRFMERAADLVVSHAGSLSGEHGDGQSRGELLGGCSPPELVGAFGELKAIFDPAETMNPGKVVHPARRTSTCGSAPLGARHAAGRPSAIPRTAVPSPGRQPVRRRRPSAATTPTRAGRDVPVLPGHPRRRALDARPRPAALRDAGRPGDDHRRLALEAVRDALDLCLACKGCKTDCPVNIDMATYKAEFLARHYRRRLRPAAHYPLGWLPLGAARQAAPRLVNTLSHAPRLTRRSAASAGSRRSGGFPGSRDRRRAGRDRPRAAGAAAARCCSSPTPSPARFHAGGRRRGRGARLFRLAPETPATRPCCGLTALDGPVRHGSGRFAGPSPRLAGARRPGLRSSSSSRAAPRCSAPTRRGCSPAPGARCASAPTASPAGLLTVHTPGRQPPPFRLEGALAQVHCHEQAAGASPPPPLLGEAGRAPQLHRLLRAGGELRYGEGPRRVSEARAEGSLAQLGEGEEGDAARRRLQLPHPGA